MTQREFIDRFLTGNPPAACSSAMRWLREKYPHGEYDLRKVWRECPNADWLIWMSIRASTGVAISRMRRRAILAAKGVVSTMTSETGVMSAAIKQCAADKFREMMPCPWDAACDSHVSNVTIV